MCVFMKGIDRQVLDMNDMIMIYGQNYLTGKREHGSCVHLLTIASIVKKLRATEGFEPINSTATSAMLSIS